MGVAQAQNPIHRFHRQGGVQRHIALSVKVVGAPLAQQHIVGGESQRFDIISDNLFGGGDVIVPGLDLFQVDTRAFPNVAPVVENHRGQGMFNAINFALVAVECFARRHQLFQIAAFGQPIFHINQPRISAAQETAKAPLLNVRNIRRANATGLEGDLQLIVHVAIGNLRNV